MILRIVVADGEWAHVWRNDRQWVADDDCVWRESQWVEVGCPELCNDVRTADCHSARVVNRSASRPRGQAEMREDLHDYDHDRVFERGDDLGVTATLSMCNGNAKDATPANDRIGSGRNQMWDADMHDSQTKGLRRVAYPLRPLALTAPNGRSGRGHDGGAAATPLCGGNELAIVLRIRAPSAVRCQALMLRGTGPRSAHHGAGSAAATALPGTACGTISGGLILDRGLVLARGDGSARRVLAQAGGLGHIGRREAHDSSVNRGA